MLCSAGTTTSTSNAGNRSRFDAAVPDRARYGCDDGGCNHPHRLGHLAGAAVARLRLGADGPRGDGEANRERNDQRPLMCSV